MEDGGPRGCYRPSKNDWIQNERGKKVTKAGKQKKNDEERSREKGLPVRVREIFR